MDAFLDGNHNLRKKFFNELMDKLIENNEINKSFLMDDDNDITLLQYGVYMDLVDDDFLTKFVKNGGDVNKGRLNPPITPLEISICRGKKDMALKLISNGAKISKSNLISYIQSLNLYGIKIDKEFFKKLVSSSPKENYLNVIIFCNNLPLEDIKFMITELKENDMLGEIPHIRSSRLRPDIEEYLRINNLYVKKEKRKSIFFK